MKEKKTCIDSLRLRVWGKLVVCFSFSIFGPSENQDDPKLASHTINSVSRLNRYLNSKGKSCHEWPTTIGQQIGNNIRATNDHQQRCPEWQIVVVPQMGNRNRAKICQDRIVPQIAKLNRARNGQWQLCHKQQILHRATNSQYYIVQHSHIKSCQKLQLTFH